MLPFLLAGNISLLFFEWKALNEHKYIKKMMIISFVFVLIVLTLVSISASAISVIFDPFILQNISSPSSPKNFVTNATRASFCDISIENWTLLELSALSVIPHNTKNLSVGETLAQYISPNMQIHWSLDVEFPYTIAQKDNMNVSVVIFQGITSKIQVGFLIENCIFYWFELIAGAIIPFFEVIYSLFFPNTLKWLSFGLSYHLLGIYTLSDSIFKNYNNTLDFRSDTKSFFVGHMSGGILAKAFSHHLNMPALALESPVYSTSMISHFTTPHESGSYIINLFSETSFFSMFDPNVSVTIKLLPIQTLFNPSNPYETFCMIAAGCEYTDWFDNLCRDAITMEKYLNYFTLWNRTRYSTN